MTVGVYMFQCSDLPCAPVPTSGCPTLFPVLDRLRRIPEPILFAPIVFPEMLISISLSQHCPILRITTHHHVVQTAW